MKETQDRVLLRWGLHGVLVEHVIFENSTFSCLGCGFPVDAFYGYSGWHSAVDTLSIALSSL